MQSSTEGLRARRPARTRSWPPLFVLLATCVTLAACRKESAPAPEPSASGGLAGSPAVGLAAPDTTAPDVSEDQPSAADLAPSAPDVVVPLPPEPSDATSAPPPPAAPDAGPPVPPSLPVPDAASAARRDVTRADAASVPSRPEAGREAAAAPGIAVRPDAVAEIAPPDDAGRPPDATAPDLGTTPDAGPSGPPAADVVRTFAGLQRDVQRCAEAEGPGRVQVRARVRGSDGRVREVSLDSPYTDAAEQCIRNLVATLRFPTFAGESATLEHAYTITEMQVGADVGADASLQQQLEAEEARLRRLAKRCIVGVEGPVTVHVWIDADRRTATLRRVDGDVTDAQRACLAEVARGASVPNVPASTERAWRIQ